MIIFLAESGEKEEQPFSPAPAHQWRVAMQFFLILLIFLLALTLILFLMRFGLLLITVTGNSMQPTLQPGERILVVRRWLSGRLRKGQIIVGNWPDQERNFNHVRTTSQRAYVKRIVALADETFTTSIPGERTLDLPEEIKELESSELPTQEKTWKVPLGHIFVCGDNRDQSDDSRSWGPVPLHNVLGVMLMKLASIDRSDAVHPLSSEDLLLPGESAPPFSARTISGDLYELTQYAGRSLFLLFITPNRLVRRGLPSYLETARRQVVASDIVTLFVCDATLEETQALVQEFQIELPVLVVPAETHPFFQDYRVTGTPAYCLIDAEGKVQSSGFLSFSG